MIFDYATLKVIWWCTVGLILIVFALTDGWDLGIGMLSPFLGKSDLERRVILRAIEPNWEGNQTWLVIAGGVIFAAWPLVYAASFSGMYVAMLLVLFALFFRPVGFKYRNKVEDPRWRRWWDRGLFVGGFVPALVFGIAFGNLLLGLPFHFDVDLRASYTGSFWQLLNPFALLAGVVSVSMLVMHGAAYLKLRVDGVLQERAGRAARIASAILIVAFAAAGAWVAGGVEGYRITAMPDTNGALNPLAKSVAKASGAWLDNYGQYRWLLAAPVGAFAGAFGVLATSSARFPLRTLAASGLAVVGIILTAGGSMFPFIMPSASHPSSSLTAWDAVSSRRTLQIMLWVTVLFMPLIAMYSIWAYAKMSGKVTAQTVQDEH
ncbi:MAG: cytochrome d ubiquinol oxidase subunit II [Betaproteobacteria bacterium]|nr:MAG: cytochrome d ubiquinol oxidase subunit II [Betaproteobacteria bacterium]